MFDFLKRKKQKTQEMQPEEVEQAPSSLASEEQTLLDDKKGAQATKPQDKSTNGLFSRFKKGLSKTRVQFKEGVASLVLGKKVIDKELLYDLEDQLLLADVGVEATKTIVADLTLRISRREIDDPQALLSSLKNELFEILKPCEQPLQISPVAKPFVILVMGVNGVGKTTTIGKLAKRLQQQGKKVMLAAGDTFRAAAIEQLQIWGERNQMTVIAQEQGADSASVIYDAVQAAKARDVDVLIADTAGRLHTQTNLMEELKKVRRVISKLDPAAPHEALLILDASTGQNALNQAKQFNEVIPITGITITKLDGTAKGGIIFAIAKKMKVPIRFIGVGEQIDDLKPFNAEEFVQGLFTEL